MFRYAQHTCADLQGSGSVPGERDLDCADGEERSRASASKDSGALWQGQTAGDVNFVLFSKCFVLMLMVINRSVLVQQRRSSGLEKSRLSKPQDWL